MMINENPDFENENEEEGTSGGNTPSFTGPGGGLVGTIVKETVKEGTREVSRGFFSWLGELLSDDE